MLNISKSIEVVPAVVAKVASVARLESVSLSAPTQMVEVTVSLGEETGKSFMKHTTKRLSFRVTDSRMESLLSGFEENLVKEIAEELGVDSSTLSVR